MPGKGESSNLEHGTRSVTNLDSAAIDPQVLDEIVERIVRLVQPEKIVLFGSAARGMAGPNSDIDLLVVKAGAHRLNLTTQIYRTLRGVGAAVDIVVVRPEDIQRYGNNPALVIAPAISEGRVLYAG